MKKRVMLTLSCLFLSIGFIVAQTTKASGTVVDDNGEPVISASVVVKGTTVGTVTDLDGKFSINVPDGKNTLVFTLVGMKSVEAKAASNMNIVMENDDHILSDVVVTGYGTFKKSSFTGSASSLTTDKIKDVPVVSVADKLAGAVSGVTVTSTSGQPGGAESVRIRGMGSINAGNNPLYVVDGVPIQSGNSSEFTYADSGASLLSTISSSDIESITVIKDAAAASLYGSRAANGVIVITTKQGVAGKTRVNLKADWGFSNFAIDYRPTLGGQERRDLLYAGLVNLKTNAGQSDAQAKTFANSEIDKYAAMPATGWVDWKDLLLRNGSRANYEANIQGGNDKTKFFASLGYTDQEGVSIQSGFERYSGRVNVTHKAERFFIEASTMISSAKQTLSNEGTSFASPIMAVYGIGSSPSYYPYDKDGNYTRVGAPLNSNPLESAKLNYNKNKTTRSLSNISVAYDLGAGFNIRERLSYDFIDTRENIWWDPRSNDGRTAGGVHQIVDGERTTLGTQTQLTYIQTFNKLHNVDALVAFETEDFKYSYLYTSGTGFPTYKLPELINASVTSAESNINRSRQASYLGRVNYDYASKYYLGISLRTDGLSRLSSDNRWGTFWSLSGSWRLSQENFWQGSTLANLFSDAKVRASYGTNGTRPDAFYDYFGVYKYGYKYDGVSGSAEARQANPNLKWEKNFATNIGLDLSFKDILTLTFDWYNRDTEDLLYDVNVSQVTGFETRLANIGKMRNRGFEVELKSNNIMKSDFSWTTSLNLAHNKNEVLKLDDSEEGQYINGARITKVGHPLYAYYAYEYAGVDPATGKESFYINGADNSRETTTDQTKANKTIIGSYNPDITGGLTNFITWKGFDLGFTFTFSLGGDLYDYATWLQSNGGARNYNAQVPAYYKLEDMWQKAGDNAKLPQYVFGNINVQSSRWMMSSDHLRLKNLTFGYTLPTKVVRKAYMEKVRLYASGSNIFTWKSKDTYLDPESRVDGLVTFETPTLRSFTFGIEIGF